MGQRVSSEGSRGLVDSSSTRRPCDTAASWAWENALEYTAAVYCYISRGGASLRIVSSQTL